MNLNPPIKVRTLLYVVTGLGSPIVAYLSAKGIIGNLEVALWSAEVTVVSVMASLNTISKS